MNTQTMLNNANASTEATNKKMTKEELQQKSDAEILALIDGAKGHTGKDFSEVMNCDFSYSYLTGVLSDRGYEIGWHKTSEGNAVKPKPTVIQMKKSDVECHRQSYMIEDSIAQEWKDFNKAVPYKTVTLAYALRRFMDDYKSGLIKFELEL